MQKVFVYWDNSNIFHEAQRYADMHEDSPGARYLVRIHFDNMFALAKADRHVEKAYAAGSIPPELRSLWNRLENTNRGIEAELFDRGDRYRSEQQYPDQWLQLRMLENMADYHEYPGIAVLLTGDGAGYGGNTGFHRTLERMHGRGWRVEILAWQHSCNRSMREWAQEHGLFVALDDHYDSVTFREPSREGFMFALPRDAAPLELSKRPISSAE